MTEPQGGSRAAVPTGAPQLEAEERRRSVVLFLVGLAAAILVFWPGVFHLVPGAAFPVSAAPMEGVAGGNVVLVGYNGSQKFFVWASPGSVVRWDVAFCNVAEGGVSVVVKVVEVPKGVRRFLFYINETRFGWDGVNYTEWRTLFRPRACVPGRLKIVVDSRGARDTVYLIKWRSRLSSRLNRGARRAGRRPLEGWWCRPWRRWAQRRWA